jgi:hypothetical protein
MFYFFYQKNFTYICKHKTNITKKQKEMKNELKLGDKLINTKYGYEVIFKSLVQNNKLQFRTMDDFQLNINEFVKA